VVERLSILTDITEVSGSTDILRFLEVLNPGKCWNSSLASSHVIYTAATRIIPRFEAVKQMQRRKLRICVQIFGRNISETPIILSEICIRYFDGEY
jgi:hypothetical protein